MSEGGFAAYADEKLVSSKFLNPQTRKLIVKDTPQLKKLQIQFETVLEHGLFDEALVYIEKILEINRHNPSALFNKGTILMELKRWDEALDCFDEKLVIVEDHAGTHVNKAVCLILKLPLSATEEQIHNNYSEALRSLERAIKLDPEDSVDNIISLKGIALKGLKREDEALEIFETLSKKYPNEIRYLEEILLLSKSDDKTICNKILKIDPDNFSAFNRLATHYYKIGEDTWSKDNTTFPEKNAKKSFEEAIHYFDKALNVKNKDELAHSHGVLGALFAKSASLMVLKKYEDAIECLEKIDTTNVVDKISVLSAKSTGYIALKNWEKGADCCYKILDLDEKNIHALTRLGMCLNAQGKLEDSQVYFEMAEELGWDEIHDEVDIKTDLARLQKTNG